MEREENTPGLCCIGVALHYTSPVTDALSCSVPSHRLSDDRVIEIGHLLTQARQHIEETAPLQGTW